MVAKSRESPLSAAIAGERQALEALVAELLPRVRNLTRYLVRGDADVDDVAQEALVAIVRGLRRYRGDGSLRAWADRVTTRVAVKHVCRRRRERRDEEPGADLTVVPDPEVGPDGYAARRRAVALLDELPDEQRQALVMHHLLGRSVPEIARELDVPAETVRSRLRVGMGKLRARSEEVET